jgi:flagellin
MSLGVNTNISSLTAQRALATADKDLATSMERLSTGKRINTASDDAAGMAIATRLTSQINGLNQAVKNANSAIALTQTIDGALDEVTEMLQRARELSVQSASSTVSATDRSFIQDEITQLMSEIDRIASSTQYNGQSVLDGTFTGNKIQIGANGGETLSISVDNAAASAIGNYVITGDVIKEQGSTSGNANITDAADDIIITGTATSTIDVATGDSAKQVAAKINAVTATTGVTAEAKTQALIYTDKVAAQTFTLKVNGTDTASFSISSSDVSAGVIALNNISATTGVTAEATAANRIMLTSADGSDIRVENESTDTDLRAKNLKFDGTEITAVAAHAVKQDTAVLATNTAHVFVNNSTGVETSFSTVAQNEVTEFEAVINTALSATSGTSGVRETTDAASTLGTGDYYLSHTSTGNVYRITVADATVAGWQTAVTTAVYEGGSFSGETANLADTSAEFGKLITVYDAGDHDNTGKVGIQSGRHFGDFEIYSDSALSVNIANNNRAVTGIEATGVGVYGEDSTVAIAAVGVEVAASQGYTADMDASLEATPEPTTANDGAARVFLEIINGDAADDSITDVKFTVTGTNRDGNVIRETVDTGTITHTSTASSTTTATTFGTTLEFASVTAVEGINIGGMDANDNISVGYLTKDDTFNYVGARTMGDFDITAAGSSVINTSTQSGDLDTSDSAFTASSTSTNDTLTFQGGIQLTSGESFSVTQSSTEGGTAASNDNYLTSGTSALSAVSSVSVATQAGAESAMKTIDGAIEKVAQIRSSLGAIENRLGHTVDNLMNVSENSTAARASLTDADFSVESANLAKAQVLLQAGTAMLAQANAAPQMVLQLLQ